ncbi:MAG: ATP-binding protein [Defluviitaleaceae bacterium]|nr:ATP-binding protein [Defluviitaleaceae bacterium]
MKKRIFRTMCVSTFISLGAASIALITVLVPTSHMANLAAAFAENSVVAVVSGVIFVLVACFINYFLALSITKQITNTISKIDFNAPEDIEIYDELSSFVRTILRQQKQIESNMQEISEQANTIRSIFDNMQEGLVMLDSTSTVVAVNHFAVKLFAAQQNCEGNNIHFLTRDTIFLNKVKAALQGHSGQMLMELEKIYQVSFIPSSDKGAIILIADVTERQLAEKMRREFSANVSHELNTPLTCIMGFADIIGKGNIANDDILYFANKISNESRRMIDMIENILLLSRLDEMDGREAYTEFDLSQPAAEAINSLQALAERSQIKLILVDSFALVQGNRHLIYMVFMNLISNAIRYNKAGGEVKIAVSAKKRFAYINVTDTGIGIPKEEKRRIFERFYRVEQSRNQSTGGAGLGLSIVKHIIRYHKGTIELESTPGQGTSIFVRIPTGVGEV